MTMYYRASNIFKNQIALSWSIKNGEVAIVTASARGIIAFMAEIFLLLSM